MNRRIERLMREIKRKSIYVVITLLSISFHSCVDSLDQKGSNGPPSFTQQILLNAIPASIFGNGCSFVDIEAIFNQLLTPNGATIRVVFNTSVLNEDERGCITSVDPVVINGRAFIEYLGGPVIGTDFVGSVNVGVTVTLPNGVQQSNFVPVTIVGVGILEPIIGPTMITANPAPVPGQPAPPPVFETIQVDTQGIVPGTFVDFEVFDPTCGFLTDATPVLGSTAQGVAIVQYNAIDGVECTQTVIVMIEITDPFTKDPSCASIPVEDRTIQASITFDQIVGPTPSPIPTPGPSPIPTPGPSPTPTPTPITTIDVQAFNTQLSPGDDTLITATTNTGPNTPVCCDFLFNSDPESFLTLGAMTTPPAVCGLTDVNGDLFTILTAGNVVTDDFVLVRCCIDSNTTANACDPTDVAQASVQVDISPTGVPPPISLEADPSSIPPGGTSTIIASTADPPVPAGTNICFAIEIPSSPISTLSTTCADATSGGQAVVGLTGGLVPTQQTVTVRGCIEQDMLGNGCIDTDPSAFTSVIIVPPTPTPTPAPTAPPSAITISSTNLAPSAGGNTIIDVVTNPSANNCVFFVVNSTTASTLQTINPLGATSTTEACGMAVSGQNSYRLNVDGTASTEQIRVQGCIDNSGAVGVCDGTDPLSNTLTFFIP